MPTLRRCRHCPALIPPDAYRGLCDTCRRTWDRERGSREERGYGAEHRSTRAETQARIDAGQVVTYQTKAVLVVEGMTAVGSRLGECSFEHPDGVPLHRRARVAPGVQLRHDSLTDEDE